MNSTVLNLIFSRFSFSQFQCVNWKSEKIYLVIWFFIFGPMLLNIQSPYFYLFGPPVWVLWPWLSNFGEISWTISPGKHLTHCNFVLKVRHFFLKVRRANSERARLTRLQKKEIGLATMLMVVVFVFFVCNVLALVVNILEVMNINIIALNNVSNLLVSLVVFVQYSDMLIYRSHVKF